MSAADPMATVAELRELLDGNAPMDVERLFAVILPQLADTTETLVKREDARVSGFKRRAIPDQQRAAERVRVVKKFKYARGAGYPRAEALAYVTRVLALPMRRVRDYLKHERATRTCDKNEAHDYKVGNVILSCPACMTGETCIDHATARQVFNAALPEHLNRMPHSSLRRAIPILKNEDKDSDQRTYRRG
jgi:hypothetical protein